ncbi:zinc ribbon domain-containing protein [Thermoactinospora rubra]|uniref:zinc ribbon domain-containing protein n=1 Tax=Thermoactinospora rubra TaxID=1088767 RepID=UPI000A0FF4DA|nr:zinc ribbon domain-containing protein [Thermoactinospora rubra]
MQRHIAPVALVSLLGLVAVGAVPAQAHEHPSGITDLVTPAVVRVEASQHVDITLLEHRDAIVPIERGYNVPIGSGTGIVVNPDGAVVVLTRVVDNDKDAGVYAANRIIADHYDVDIPADFERHTVEDERVNRELNACYPPEKRVRSCFIKVTTKITVYPNLNPPDPKGFEAEIVKLGDSPDSPAVLQPTGRGDGSVGLPTAPLADKVPDKEGSPVAVAGFPGRPSATVKLVTEIAHLGKGGSAGDSGRPFADPQKKVDEPPKLGALADKGLLGAPVIGDKEGKVVGLLVGGGREARMIGVREITAALAEAGVQPRRGQVDAAFETALTRFHTKYYTEAIPAFQRVLDLYPGHTVAAEHLRTSLTKRGTAEDKGGSKTTAPAPGGGLPLWPFLAAAVLLLLAAAGGFLLWRRRAVPEAAAPSGAAPPPFDEGAHATSVVSRTQLEQALQRHQQPPQQSQQHQYSQPLMTAQPQQVKFCTSCGMRLGAGHRFCGYCGHPSES